MRTIYGDDGLGLDLTPLLQAAQAGADIYSKVETTRRGPATATQLPPVVNVQAPAARPAAGSKTLTYLLVGLAAIGGGVILYRAIRRRP